MERTFIKAEIEQMFGRELLPKSTIQLYTDRGAVKPYQEPARRGLPRKYNVTNLIELLLCRKMIDLGFTLADVTEILHRMRQTDELGALFTVSRDTEIAFVIEYKAGVEGESKIAMRLELPIKGTENEDISVTIFGREHIRIINISEIMRLVKQTL